MSTKKLQVLNFPQSDWNQTDEKSSDYIKNKPDIDNVAYVLQTSIDELREYVDDKISETPALDGYTKTEVDVFLEGKANTDHNHNDKYDAIGSAEEALSSANEYTDNVASGKADLGHNHNGSYDTLGSADSALKTAKEYTDSVSSSKADLEHNHTISEVTNLQTSLDDKANLEHTHTIEEVTNLQSTLDNKSDVTHNHDSNYDTKGSASSALTSAKSYSDSLIADEVTDRNSAIATAKSSAISTASSDATTKANNALKSAKEYTDTVADTKADLEHIHDISDVTNLQSVLDSKSSTSHNHDSKYDSKGSASSALSSAKEYADVISGELEEHTSNSDIHFTADERTKLAGIASGAQKNTITGIKGNAESSYRTGNVNITPSNIGLGNVNNTSDANKPVSTAQQSAIDTSLASAKSYTDTKIANLINGAPSTLDTLKEVADAIAANDSVVDALETAIGTKANASDLTAHTGNSDIHFTASERTKLSGIASGAEVNQNAFSNVKVGDTTVSADSKTDTLTLAGSNVTITPDTTNDKITISVASASTSAKGIVQLTNSTSSTSTTTAATPNSVKSAYDLANTAKTNAATAQATADGKADAEHTHEIADVTGLQSALDSKAASSHGTHVSYSTTAPVMDGTASVGSASTVARSDHRHPIDTSRAAKSDFDSHVADTTKHITSTERTNWGKAYTHSQAAHAPSNAEPNQNAFSNVTVGSTTIAADSKTDTLTLVAGSNVTITPDATNDKITIAAKDTVYTHPTSSGNKHIPSGGSSGQILRWASDGTAAWGADNNTTYTLGSFGVTATKDELNKLDGVTATTAELNYVDGVTSNIQTQLDGKVPTSRTVNGKALSGNISLSASDVGAAASSHNHAASNITSGTLSSDRLPTVPISKGGTGATSASGALTNLGITATAGELNYVDGVTSNIQTQLNAKAKGGSISATTAATAGWYRIATSSSGINKCIGTFEIEATVSGKHSTAIITASSNYGVAASSTINVLHCSQFSGAAITKARIVYHTTYSGNYAYVEVYNPNATAIPINVKLIGGTGWSLVKPSTAVSVPSGYSSKEVTLSNGTIVAGTFSGSLSGNASTATKATQDASGNTITSTYATKSELNSAKSSLQTAIDGKAASSHTHSYAGSSSVGGSATSAVKLDSSAGSATQPVYFSSGKPVACTYTLAKSVPSNAVFTDTNTHYTTKIYAGASGTAANAAATSPYIKIVDDSTYRNQIRLVGSGSVTVTSDASGNVTIKGTDTNTTYGAATTSAAGLMSASDKSKLDGITSSADSVSFSRSLTSGTKIGTLTINGTGTDLYCQTNTNTTYSNFVKSGSGAKAGLVPAPSTTAGTTKYLREDGTWAVPPDTNTDTKVTISANAPTSATSYYPIMHTNTSGTTAVTANGSTRYSHLTGTASAEGYNGLILGNATATGKAGNSTGRLYLYSASTNRHMLKGANTTSEITHTLPATSGTILNSGTTSFTQSLTSGTAIGTLKINGSSTTLYAPTNTNTMNTAGSTNSSSKLFLIGATSQAANPVTYSHDTAYVGTDGCLYSNSKKVSVEGHTHSYLTLKGTNTISSTSNDTVANWAKQLNSVHWYNTNGLINNQLNQHGYILNFTSSNTEVYQIWMTAPNGDMAHRGGNASGWSGSWKTILDSSNYGGYGTYTTPIQIEGNGKHIKIGTGDADIYIHNSKSGKYLQLRDDGRLGYDNEIVPCVRWGTGNPDNSWGKDGDIYIKYS